MRKQAPLIRGTLSWYNSGPSISDSFAIMYSIKSPSMILIHLQFCAIALTATLPIPRPTLLLNSPECRSATVPQYSHTNRTNPVPTPLLDPPLNLSLVCRQFPGGFVVYNVKAPRLDLSDVSWVFQMAILDSRFHPGRTLMEMSKVYEKNDVELLIYPGPTMTWRHLEAVSFTLRIYVNHVTTFSIFDKQWQLLGNGKVGLI